MKTTILTTVSVLILVLTSSVSAELVAHWKLDEAQGPVAHDSAGTKHGVVYGNAAWQPSGGIVDAR